MFFMNSRDGDINPVAAAPPKPAAARPAAGAHQQVHAGDAQRSRKNMV
jgi:hypothetical protein